MTLFTFLLTYTCVFSQTLIKYQVSGLIVDSTSKTPLAGISLIINKKGSAINQSTATLIDGKFKFNELTPGSYIIAIKGIGYTSKQVIVDSLTSSSPKVDLNTIYLTENTIGLKNVVISESRPIIIHKADRVIYDLKADPQSKTSTVLNMMRKIPYLSVDGDDNLLLKGNSSFRVLINGKPASSLEGNLKAVLKSLPAATIEKIEVITLPPSKYDAEGLAGIINIITSKKVNDGFSGTFNLNQSFPVGGTGIGTSFNSKQGKFGISAFGGASLSKSPETGDFSQRNDKNATILQQSGNQYSDNKVAYFGTNLSYLIDTLNLIAAQLNYNGSRGNEHLMRESRLNNAEDLLQQYDLSTDNQFVINGLDVGLNYEKRFKGRKDQLLTFSYLFAMNQNNKEGNSSFDNLKNLELVDLIQENHQQFKEHTFQIDFLTPYKKLIIEAGIKGIVRANSSNFDLFSIIASTGIFEKDMALSDDFNNTQNVFSAYNSYKLELKSWNISAGFRLEETVVRARFSSTTSVANQNYLHLIPALAVGKGFKNGSSINFGFSQRIRRPGINRLNPYIDRANPNYLVTGNPNLRPVVLNDIQFGYGNNKKLSVNLGINYSFMNNLDLRVLNFNPLTNISIASYENTGKSKSSGINFNLGYPISSIYSVGLNGNLMYLQLKGQDNGMELKNELTMYSINFSNALRLKHNWVINMDLGGNSSDPTGLQGYSNGFFYSSIGFNKEIIKDKFSFGATIRNPFTKYRDIKNTTFGPQFREVQINKSYFRSFNFSMNYNFGGLKDRINKNRKGIENNDLSN